MENVRASSFLSNKPCLLRYKSKHIGGVGFIIKLNQATPVDMERLFRPYDKEYMRMAMLKHEETFKQQVYELHRLYRIQKILMKSIENSRDQERRSSLDQIHHYHQSFMTQKSRSIKLELEMVADNPIAESNGDGMLEMIDESEIELTLGLGPSKKAETPPLYSDSSSTGSSHINTSSVQVELQNLKHPPWLFQVLSLNIT